MCMVKRFRQARIISKPRRSVFRRRIRKLDKRHILLGSYKPILEYSDLDNVHWHQRGGDVPARRGGEPVIGTAPQQRMALQSNTLT